MLDRVEVLLVLQDIDLARMPTDATSVLQSSPFWFIHHENMSVNVYPLERNFYIAKLWYAEVYLFFLFLLQNIDCGYSLEPPQPWNRLGEAVLTCNHSLCFFSKNKRNSKNFLLKIFIFLQF